MKNEANLPLEGRRILIAISGSIAAVKTPLLVSELIKTGAEVRCIVTPSAAHLVSPLALSTLSRNRCYQNEDQWNPIETKPLHIALAEWAEIVVVAPLSASTLARWTQGLGEGLLASVLLACEKPIIAAAAMNTSMWSNIAVQRNWTQLQSYPAVLTLNPSKGLLACDRTGEGRMVDPELIVLAITSGILQIDKTGTFQRDWRGLRLLATAGPTAEDLDPARFITNRSSGRMGVLLAQAARLRGATVDLVHGQLDLPKAWLEGLTTHSVRSAAEMQKILSELQSSVNVVAMTAAVADIRRKNGGEAQKLSKECFLVSLENNFEPVPDLLADLSIKRPTGQVLLGFAALTGDDKQIETLGKEKRLKKGCDLLMANPIDRDGQGFETNANGGILLGPGEMVRKLPVTSKLSLANQLLDALRELPIKVSETN